MIKCPHCGREFDETGKPKAKWYFPTYRVVIGLLCFGPFAMPMVWFNPRYKRQTKWIVTIAVTIITIIIIILFIWMALSLMHSLQQLFQQTGGAF